MSMFSYLTELFISRINKKNLKVAKSSKPLNGSIEMTLSNFTQCFQAMTLNIQVNALFTNTIYRPPPPKKKEQKKKQNKKHRE